MNNEQYTGLETAVIGMSGRFPGSGNINDFWMSLVNGKESITTFSEEELRESGIAEEFLNDPTYVRAYGWMPDIEYFDASFFGYTPADAELMDPQVRIFHEIAYEALENAGYDSFSYDKLIGLYAGGGPNLPWQARGQMSPHQEAMGPFAAKLLHDKDYMCTRVAYKLGLKGPAVLVDTACSTSLVAVHMACQALISGDCDMAIAGGINITVIKKSGYPYHEGMLRSPDGHCRAFDAEARGTNFGNGGAAVILKRLEDAIADNDTISAVIRGSAMNNDGIAKSTYTAPGIEGQAAVIRNALNMAEVEPETIGFVEAHGTGTELGDPVEFEGLRTAFNTSKRQYCRLGAVKTNLGHLEQASGIAGLIKTVLSLKHKLIPPTLFFKTPNPKIDFANSPFFVNTELSEWHRMEPSLPLRAGVSSFGIGGTNAHVVLEEWTGTQPTVSDRSAHAQTPAPPAYLLVFSASTQPALESAAVNLREFFEKNRTINMANAAFTLQTGRRRFARRRMLVCADIDDAITQLSNSSQEVDSHVAGEDNPPLTFYFPGKLPANCDIEDVRQSMCFKHIPEFRTQVELCLSTAGESSSASLAFFSFTFAAAHALIACGIQPVSYDGSGSGKILAQCVSGDISLKDALNSFSNTISDTADSLSDDAVQADSSLLTFDGNGARINISIFPGQDDYNRFLELLGQLWLTGVDIDWAALRGGEPGKRIPMPTYPFQRRRYWLEMKMIEQQTAAYFESSAGSTGKSGTDTTVAIYLPTWERHPFSMDAAQRSKMKSDNSGQIPCWLVIEDGLGLAANVSDRLTAIEDNGDEYVHVIRVTLGTNGQDFSSKGDDDASHYIIDPWRPEHYRELIDALSKNSRLPTHILHMGTLGRPEFTSDDLLYAGFYNLLYLVKALEARRANSGIRLTVVSHCMFDVTGSEVMNPWNAALAGAILVIPREYPGIGCRHIDVQVQSLSGTQNDVSNKNVSNKINKNNEGADDDTRDKNELAEYIFNEVAAPGGPTPVALRGRHRWIRRYEPVLTPQGKGTEFKNDGVYLLLGGLGRLGLTLAEQMAGAGFKKLILTGKSPLPPRTEWAGHSNSAFQLLQQMESQGAELLVMETDIADEALLDGVFKAGISRFGHIDGIIHAAGPMDKDTFPSIWSLTPRLVDEHFSARGRGIELLEKVMQRNRIQPDFIVTLSSLASLLGGPGCAAYTASHAVMEGFVRKPGNNHRWFDIAWDGWQTPRIHRDEDGNPVYLTGREAAKLAVSRFEGFNLLRRVLSWDDERSLAVSRAPLQDRINAFVHVRPENDSQSSGSIAEPAAIQGERLEQFIAQTWKEILKCQTLDPAHNLFDLGAVSRDMVRANWLLNRRLKRHIPLDLMFRFPTVALLSKYLSSGSHIETVSQDKLATATKRMTNTLQRLKHRQ